jgi:nicotinate-nucleotide adenylyltransferase
MPTGRRLGVLGGTFDPIHVGHLDAAEAARTALALDVVRLVPTGDPPHRPAGTYASWADRLAMARLAVAEQPGFEVSDMEIARGGRSYTADTLRVLHGDGWAAAQIFFILGLDAFADIATWREFPAVLEGAHFVVISRPGAAAADAPWRHPALAPRVCTPEALPAGGATAIVPIEARTRDVSSSAIRRRLANGEDLGALVPPGVAGYIRAHALYRRADKLHDQDAHD